MYTVCTLALTAWPPMLPRRVVPMSALPLLSTVMALPWRPVREQGGRGNSRQLGSWQLGARPEAQRGADRTRADRATQQTKQQAAP